MPRHSPLRTEILVAVMVLGCNGRQQPSAQGVSQLETPVSDLTVREPDTSTPLPPKQFDFGDVWCLSRDAIYDEALLHKHVPPGMTITHGTNEASRQRPDYIWPTPFCGRQVTAQREQQMVGWTVSCGNAYMGKRRWAHEEFEKAKPDSAFPEGVLAHRVQGFADISLWDNDAPCKIQVDVREFPDKYERAEALAKDLLQFVTPARIRKPQFQYVVAASDETGDLARQELERFKVNEGKTKEFVQLSSGYPKVVDSDDYPGMPPNKHYLLLGVCANDKGRAFEDVLHALVPRASEGAAGSGEIDTWNDSFNVERADITEEECPSDIPTGAVVTEVAFAWRWVQEDGKILTVGFINDLNAVEGEPIGKLAGFLYDKQGHVLDSKIITEDVPSPQTTRGRYSSQATETFGQCRLSMWHEAEIPTPGFFCESYWNDQKCSDPGHRKIQHKFEVDGNRLVVERKVFERNGEGCKPNITNEY